jgi:hypothetical protein
MKYFDGKRGLLRAVALAQVLLLAVTGCKSSVDSGVKPVAVTQALDGDLTVSTSNCRVNGYSALTAATAVGVLPASVTVHGIADFTADTTSPCTRSALAVGDLVLIIQMAGATINTAEPTFPSDPNNYVTPASYGSVTSLGSAGNYELNTVASITTNTIGLACALKKSYSAAGNTQVIRVPQYNTLTIVGGTDAGTDAGVGGSITAPAWDSTTGVGGVVALSVANTLQLDGDINVSYKGFHGGGYTDGARTAGTDVPLYLSNNLLDGGEKGESIAGLAASLATGGYGRGAPANGGGGGNSHNGGGGGGANATSANAGDAALSDAWTGQGVMLSGVLGGTAAWPLDPAYIAIGRYTTSSGGGRGGYTYSSPVAPPPPLPLPTAVGPNNAVWGGNNRREHGGLGGHPLVSSTSDAGGKSARLFLGGGGGAGNGNNTFAGGGGSGGGLAFVIAGNVAGSGSILANGQDGNPANSGGSASGDAPGGGGGGGTVVVHAGTLASTILVEANGGLGGGQINLNNAREAEGPGGGGGGGYVALSGGTPTRRFVSGGSGGTTTAASMTTFPTNGATAGHDGLIESAADILICTAPTDAGVDATAQEAGIEVGAPDTTPDVQAIDGPVVLPDAGPPDAGTLDASPGLDSAGGPVALLDAGADASPGLDSADGPGSVVLLDASAGLEDAPATSEDAPATIADGPGTVVTVPDAPTAVDLAATGGKDAPPIATPDAAKDALAADAAGLLDAIIIGDAGDAGAQDAQAVVFLDAGSDAVSGDTFAVPDQAVLPPDAATVADAPISVGRQDAPATNDNIPPTPMGSGFCAVNPMRDSAPGLFTFLLVAGFALLLRRRRR